MAMNHLTNAEFVDAFMYSHRGQNIMDKILSPLEPEVSSIAPLPEFLKRYVYTNIICRHSKQSFKTLVVKGIKILPGSHSCLC